MTVPSWSLILDDVNLRNSVVNLPVHVSKNRTVKYCILFFVYLKKVKHSKYKPFFLHTPVFFFFYDFRKKHHHGPMIQCDVAVYTFEIHFAIFAPNPIVYARAHRFSTAFQLKMALKVYTMSSPKTILK